MQFYNIEDTLISRYSISQLLGDNLACLNYTLIFNASCAL